MAIHNFFPSNTFKFLLIVIFINILSTDLAITEDYLEEPKVRKVATPSHFVLVHGACFGGWSWYKIRSLLESVGHKVSSPDLISAGIQPSDPNSLHHFQEYNKPIHDILANLPQGEKVIIVGHSAGGISVTDAIRNYPEKVEVGVYTVGQMQRIGSSSTPNTTKIICKEIQINLRMFMTSSMEMDLKILQQVAFSRRKLDVRKYINWPLLRMRH
ncbi:methylesterase 17-like isoform X2 [Amaranthus tricolor]|uniref:methylesterase 17-like isoform X2 n=1 Tax=Amaranthus tricolor TaxID=29722 RepID=UPI00258EC2A3|nr:methylesterase 17-like isoform X2 [Amaranthus tricolor]